MIFHVPLTAQPSQLPSSQELGRVNKREKDNLRRLK